MLLADLTVLRLFYVTGTVKIPFIHPLCSRKATSHLGEKVVQQPLREVLCVQSYENVRYISNKKSMSNIFQILHKSNEGKEFILKLRLKETS